MNTPVSASPSAVDRTHAILAPSASDRWLNCGGSIELIGGEQSPSNQSSLEGEAAHFMLEYSLKKNVAPLKVVGKRAPNKITLTDKMAQGVEWSLDYIRERVAALTAKGFAPKLVIEAELAIPATGEKGHVDVGLIALDAGYIEVIDYKNGYGWVSADANPQLRLYALGLYYSLRLAERKLVKRVRLTILQPNTSPLAPRFEDIGIKTLLDWEAEIKPKIAAIHAKSAGLAAGDWCKWCPAAGRCPALAQKAVAAAGADFEEFLKPGPSPTGAYFEPAKSLTVVSKRRLWEAVPILELWLTRFREHIMSEVAAGKGKALGLKFVKGKAGNRVWANPATIEARLIKVLGLDKAYSKKPLSPAQAEEAFTQKAAWEAFAKLNVTRGPSSLTLVPITDPRPAVNAAAEDFAEHLK